MTAQQHREEITFPPNVPVALSLKYAQGKMVSGQHGERVMFTTCDNRVLFLDPAVAGQIEAAGINVRQPFTLTLKWDGKGPRTWDVARIAPPEGEQGDGTFAVPKLPEAKPPASASTATPATRRDDGASVLVAESIALVDAYAAVLEHALTKHSGRVKPEEVKSIFLTCAINLCGGKRHAA